MKNNILDNLLLNTTEKAKRETELSELVLLVGGR